MLFICKYLYILVIFTHLAYHDLFYAMNWGLMMKFHVPAFLSLGAIKTTISQGDSYKLQHYNATEATADAAMQ